MYPTKARSRRRKSPFSRAMEYAVAAAFLAAVAAVAAGFAALSTANYAGVAQISDGDSLRIGEQRIRLEGIDAPELSQTCRVGPRDEECGRLARSHLVALVNGRRVECAGWETDRYGRLLAQCRAGGVDINRRMVLDGWAVSFGLFHAEEAVAQAERRGLWAGEFDRPKEWRRVHSDVLDDGAEHGASLLGLLGRAAGRLAGWFSK